MAKITATKEEVLVWLREGLFTIEDGEIFSRFGNKLTAHINRRRGMESGDLRVGLNYQGKRRNVNVSHLVWMWNTDRCVPDGFEIHHKDEDSSNNNWYNLICVYYEDHPKLHHEYGGDQSKDEDCPF